MLCAELGSAAVTADATLTLLRLQYSSLQGKARACSSGYSKTASRTVDEDRAIGRACIDKALSRSVHGGEIGPDESGQDFVPSEGHQAVVLWVLDFMIQSRILLPSVVPAYHPNFDQLLGSVADGMTLVHA